MDKLTVWLLYDADTALGINNEGELVFPYDLEDTDIYGTKDVYNGKDSVLWNNLRQTFRNEIRAMYRELRDSGALTYSKVEKMFEEHQEKWPEAIFNEDAWFKYLAPLVEKGNASYLEMLQGSKESQRKWWLYNRFQYIDSKYNAGDALAAYIELRGYAKADITVTPYASIYPTILYGSSLVQSRGEAGQSYTLPCPLDSMNDTEIAIYSAPQIKSVGDLSPLLVGRANFSAATKIQDIKLGSIEAGYRNENLTYLTLGNNTMLKTLDVRNCPMLTNPVDASHCINLETVLMDGTSITGMSVPNGGVLKTLHLPATLANLTIMNQKLIEDFVLPGYSNLTTVRLENVADTIPTMDILDALQDNSRVRLIGFAWEAANTDEVAALYDKLDSFRGLDESGNTMDKAQLYGSIHMDSAQGDALAELSERYPDVEILADHIEATLYYHYDNGEVWQTETIIDGGNGTKANTLTRADTAQYTYSPDGWALTQGGDKDVNALVAVKADRHVYPAFTSTLRSYNVVFVRASADGGGTLYTQQNVPYGTVPTYGGATPTTTQGNAADYPFKGWTPEISAVDGTNLTYTAKFESPIEVVEIADDWSVVIANIENRTYKNKYNVGNYKTLTYGDGDDSVVMQIVAIDEDIDSSGNTIPITLIASTPFTDVTKNTQYGVYPSVIKRPLKINNILLENIVVAQKYTQSPSASINSSAKVSFEDIWFPSMHELGYNEDTSSVHENQGVQYNKMFKSNDDRKLGEGIAYWTRSGYKATTGTNINMYFISVEGRASFTTNGTYATRPGFCLGTYEQAHMKNVTWDQVIAWRDAGTIKNNLSLGDIIPLDLGTEGVVNAQVVAFDADDKADGSGKAAVSFVTYYLLNTSSRWNSTIISNTVGTGTFGGYGASEIEEYVTGLISKFPAELQSGIVEVAKACEGYSDSNTKHTYTENLKLFVPSHNEVFGTESKTGEPLYTQVLNSATRRKKTKPGSTSAVIWWLRSASSAYYAKGVSSSGDSNANNVTNSNALVVGFCL